jgi:signal transduction histidine kinase
MTYNAQHKATILIVDDLAANRDIMARMLTRDDYAVRTAEGGADALAQLQVTTDLPDLILLDISMPNMNGFEVCRRVKADPKTAHIPVIFVTALNELGDKVEAFEAGAVDYIIKPYKIEEVLARVNSQMTLAQQRREIIQLNETKDQLLHTVSHDLKNPIHVIRGYASLMMEPIPLKMEEVIDMATHIYNSAEKMFTLVTNLLDLTQIESGLLLDLRPLDLREVIESLKQAHELPASEKQISLSFDLPEIAVNIDADPMRLEQVFSNLMGNAIKYTPDGGRVRLEVTPHDDYVEIAIIDNGLGIPADAIPQLFDKFFRVKSEQHQRQEGTGLGLSITKAITEQHGGEITVDSVLGEGSAFIVRLPRILPE